MVTSYTLGDGVVYIAVAADGSDPDLTDDYIRLITGGFNESIIKKSKVKGVAGGTIYQIDDGKYERIIKFSKMIVTHTSAETANDLRKLLMAWTKLGTGRLYLWIMLNDTADATDAENFHFYNQSETVAYYLRGAIMKSDLTVMFGRTYEMKLTFKEVTV